VSHGAVTLYLRYHAGQQAAPAWPAHGLQNAATGHGWTGSELAGAAPVSADLLL